MKIKQLLTAIAIVLNVSLIDAQSNNSSYSGTYWDGIQNTLNNFANEIIDTNQTLRELRRKLMLRQNDIRLIMTSEPVLIENYLQADSTDVGIFNIYNSENSLYIEFDWDNMAQIMIGETTEIRGFGTFQEETGTEVGTKKDLDVLFSKHKDKEKTIQFTDRYGYWYVPVKLGSGDTMFVKFNAKQTATGMLEALLDLSAELKASDLAKELIGLTSTMDFENLISTISPDNYLHAVFVELAKGPVQDALRNKGDAELQLFENKIKNILKELLKNQFQQLEGFPIFIHWAFIYTPQLLKQKYAIKETVFDCYGLSNACKQLEVNSGPEKGKLMIFDPYDRLVLIDTKGEGTAMFQYDKDVTVRIPEAYTMQDIMSGKVIIPE